MSDFIDQMADESENDGSGSDAHNQSGSDADEPKSKKRKLQKEKKKRKQRIASSDEEEDEDDDDEAAIRKEMKGFIADEDDEEEEENDDAKSDKSKEEDDEDELDEDDMDLINENLDIGKKKPRIIQPEDSDDDLDDRTAIQRKLFGAGGDDEPATSHDRRGSFDEREDYSDSERSEDNFIVDERGERPSHHRHRRRELNVPEGALDEARDVFGVEDFNFDEFYDEDEEPMDDEEEEILEDEDGEERRVRRVRPKEKKSTLLDTMEPSELERGYLAPADKKIQLEDKPERFQTRRAPVLEIDDVELDEEALYICENAFGKNTISNQDVMDFSYSGASSDYEVVKEHVLPTIKEALKFIRNQAFEVPFISLYRKEYIGDRLNGEELWNIYRWDEKWTNLRARRSKIETLMQSMQNFHLENELGNKRQLSEEDFFELTRARNDDELNDVYNQFQLYYGADLSKMHEFERQKAELAMEEGNDDALANLKSRFKQSVKTDKYSMCVEGGLGELAMRFGLTAQQFAENLNKEFCVHEVEQEEASPTQVAADYVTLSFSSEEDALKGAMYMLAKEISRHPMVRREIRRTFRDNATICVKPTQKGREQMDDTHPIYNKRYIKAKPITALEQEDYLYYEQQRQAGAMEIRINSYTTDFDDEPISIYTTILKKNLFIKDEFSENVEEWNKLRNEILKQAIDEMLVPELEAELKQHLLDEAKQATIRKCAASIRKRIERAGFVPNEDEMEDEDDDHTHQGEVRIMAVTYSTERDEAAFGAMVDQDGAFVDYCRLLHLTKRGFGNNDNARLKTESMKLFQKFVERRRPHVVVLAAEDMQARDIRRDLQESLYEMANEKLIARAPQVFILENDAAKVYMYSKTAAAEHPDYPPTLRQAISLARITWDPLVEHAHLWNADEDILALNLHPLQREIPKDDLMEALCVEFVNKVNEIGVDVNRCLEFPHTTSMLQFVCGLGPRKAVHLLKTLKQNDNLLESRTKLVTLCRMGPKVFMNCAGFIKIDTAKVSEKTDAYVEVLDSTRVHPETYEWARKMAVDALEVDDSADPTAALEEILQAPDRLKDLDLDAFAKELERQSYGDKGKTLNDISEELHHRYRDNRQPFEAPGEGDLFYLLCKDAAAFQPGRRVLATVQRVQYKRLTPEQRETLSGDRSTKFADLWECTGCHQTFHSLNDVSDHTREEDTSRGGCPGNPVGLRMKLDNGMTGFIPNKMISDNSNSFHSPLERVKLNQAIYCKVIKVEPEKFSCLLSCKSSDLKGGGDDETRDQYWDAEAENVDLDRERDARDRRKQVSNGGMMRRVISHPSFQNINYRDAERLLRKLDQGDAIVRPSSKACDHLTVSWKVYEGIVQNVDVEEHNKDQPFTLGRRLYIYNDPNNKEGPREEFEDLDEILARYIQPMASFAREITNHKYFISEHYSEEKPAIDQRLHREMANNPNKIPYFLAASRDYPGKFTLCFMPNKRTFHEYVTVRHEGIRFRHQFFQSIDQLLSWFKVHFRDVAGGRGGQHRSYNRGQDMGQRRQMAY